MSKNSQAGFSAMEALVAVALIGLALIPLASLQTEITRGHIRRAEILDRTTAVNNALALLRDVNPAETPQGSLPLGPDATMTWRARPITERTPATSQTGEQSFEIRLYEVSVELNTSRGAYAFSIEQVGWRDPAATDSSSTRE